LLHVERPDNVEIGMRKAALAGAIAFAATVALPASAQESARAAPTVSAQVNAAIEAKIAEAKAALRLRPDQERHWPRIAAAIRRWANQGANESEGNGFIQPARRAAAVSARAAGAKRVMSAAMPLIRTLDAEQKQTALMLVQAIGLGSLAAAL
jgi:hypothetical protein